MKEEPRESFRNLDSITVSRSKLTELFMKSKDELLRFIKEKFPRQDYRIEQLYDEDKDFRLLCDDYFACMQTLKKYKRLSNEDMQTVEEYQSVLSELEKEFYSYLLSK